MLAPVSAVINTQMISNPRTSATSGKIQMRYWELNTRLVTSNMPRQIKKACGSASFPRACRQ
jgi:hypothetical protein